MRLIIIKPWTVWHTTNPEDKTIEPGEYPVEIRQVMVNGKIIRWLCLVGEPWGASLLSFLQWSEGFTPEINMRAKVYDANGRLLKTEDYEGK